MDAETLKYTRVLENGRDVPLGDDVIVRVTQLGRSQSKVELTIGGDVGRKLRIQRAKAKRRMDRPGKPRLREDD